MWAAAQVRQLLFAGVENAKRKQEYMEKVRVFKVGESHNICASSCAQGHHTPHFRG